SIDCNIALSMPGVAVAWTGKEFSSAATTLKVAPAIEGLHPVVLPPFPVDRVRFAGDLVAAVVADTAAHALDAAEAVAVEYQPLPAVTSVDAARAPAAAAVDADVPDNHISHQEARSGDVAGGFASAERVVTARFSQHRQTHVPLEPRCCIADW